MRERLGDFLKIRSGEGRLVALVVALMLATSAGGSIGGNAIEALFYARFGVQYLPYMYVALGVLSVAMTFLITALLGRYARERLYVVLPLAIAAALVLERIALASDALALYPVMWLGMNVMGSLQGLFTWGLAGLACDTRQAKRLFPLFAAGGILGAVVGGFGTRVLAESLRSENLLLVWAAALGVAFLAARALVRGRRTAASGRRASLVDDLARGFRTVRASPLMRWMVLPIVLFSLLYFSVAFPFSRAATAEFPDADSLAGFLGMFQGVTTGAAFLASLFVANRVFARVGIMAAILAFTLIYFVGFGALAIAATFPLLVTVRLAQLLWLDGFAGSAYQAMFNVVPPERRDQTRAFLDGVPGQAGTVLAGLVLVVGAALAPSQLYVVGLLAAAVAALLVWRASRAYAAALIDALRAGMPQLFFAEEEPFGGFRRDAAAVSVVVAGLRDPDPSTRRIAAEVLGHLALPDAGDALASALRDPDREVRAAALRALAASDAAVDLAALEAYLDDPDPAARARAAVALLRRAEHQRARATVAALARSGDALERTEALAAYADLRDANAADAVREGLRDERASVRRAAARAAAGVAGAGAIPLLAAALSDPDRATRSAAAEALGGLGPAALSAVLDALNEERSEEGALDALEQLPVAGAAERLRGYARTHAEEALRYHDFSLRAAGTDDVDRLLVDSLRAEARRHARSALRALAPLGDRLAIALVLRALESREPAQRANAAEALESIGDRELARPLLRLWEPPARARDDGDAWLAQLASDRVAWLRECAAFVAARKGGNDVQTLATLSAIERVLFLRRVPLFADLAPTDLKQVAAIAEERLFGDGDVLCRQGEAGEELFVIVAGEVRVLSGQTEIARRGPGEFVGEMAVISQEPRAATLVAAGDVRVLAIDRRQFEGLLQERPETSLAVMRVLAQRLRERS